MTKAAPWSLPSLGLAPGVGDDPEASAIRAVSDAPAVPAMAAVLALGLEGGRVRICVGGTEIDAALDPCVHPSVIATAIARRERVIVQREGLAWTVLGVLRTSPTPGIEDAEEYVIRAGRVRVFAGDEFTVASGAASIAVRAYGTIESLADRITSRAASVHKVIGRMLHLN